MKLSAATAALVLIAACATTVSPPPREPDPERARAALATLVIRNETAHRLEILYRTVGGGEAMVGVGHVDARATAEMAPVPAAEPLILVARTTAGTELALPPRTFTIDGTWTWLIPPDARFVRSRSGL
ncbi:MAG TPA: hypothetical protein VFZ24_04605 [Longimicrobiales bacterium]